MLYHSQDSQIKTNLDRAVLSHKSKCETKLFLGGGLGDIFSLESFILPHEANASIVYHCGYRPQSMKIATKIALPNIKHYHSFWDCLGSKDETWRYQRVLLARAKIIDPTIKKTLVGTIFKQIKNRKRKFKKSIFLETKLTSLPDLPERFVFIQPYTINATERWKPRTFYKNEWEDTIKHLQKVKIHGVVIGLGCPNVPKNNWIINLSDKTSLLEAIEILKASQGYIGIDSCFSVLAAQLFSPLQLSIKGTSPWCYSNLPIYFAPHRKFPFISKKLKIERLRL